jgi:hypothetical protein
MVAPSRCDVKLRSKEEVLYRHPNNILLWNPFLKRHKKADKARGIVLVQDVCLS